MNHFDRFFPWAVLAAAGLYLVSQGVPRSPASKGLNLDAVGNIPVLDGGRLKPLDSLARTSLMSISSRSEYEDKSGTMQPAIRWLLEVVSSDIDEVGSPAAELKVFRIENDQIVNFLNLPMRPGSYRYSFREILGDDSQRERIKKEFDRLQEKDSKKFDIFDEKMAELSKKVNLYLSLAHRNTPLVVPPSRDDQDWLSIARIDKSITAPFDDKIREMARDEVLEPLLKAKVDLRDLTKAETQRLVVEINKKHQEKVAQLANFRRADENPAAAAYVKIFQSYRGGNAALFNEAVADYQKNHLSKISDSDQWKVRFEAWLNHFEPFALCAVLFVCIFLLACCSWLGWSDPLNKAATYLMAMTLAVHTGAMIARMYIQGRPPVTNLYSSAIFIGWGAVAVSLVLEHWYRNGIGNVVGSVLGAGTMIVAHHLGANGDTLEMMQAVLDTNFWLATHVTTVTLGYMATFVAGAIGLIYIVWGIFFKSLDAGASKRISQMLYGVLCFATMLSFIGTVLGGIWADQSWGRFWGWDPKENGAVLIVLWNVLILHARWSGLVRQRGIAVLALVGNMITFWSWFGTNQLGVGLHSYGINKQLVQWCRYWWLVHLGLIGIGLLPLKYWRSFSVETIRERAQHMKAAEQLDKKRQRAATSGV